MRYLLLVFLLLACNNSTEPKPDPSISGTWRWTFLSVPQFDVVLTQNNTTFSGSGVYYTAGSAACTINGNFNYPNTSWVLTYSATTMIGSGTMTHPDTISFKWSNSDIQHQLTRH